MYNTVQKLLIICPLIFTAGFIDSIAGGGGLISMPAYVFVGLPMHNALGTNKFSSTFGTFFSFMRFMKSGHINYKSAVVSVFGALAGSFIGARLALALDEKYLKYFLLVALPVIAVYMIVKRGFGEKDTAYNLTNKKMIVLSALSGLIIGAYDGFFGPGTGTFLILVYTSVIGFNLTTSSGNAKMVNLASNVSALATFLISGKVLFALAVPAAFFGILGNWIGSGLAIKSGAKVIKPIFVVVVALLFTKIIWDFVSGGQFF